MRALWIYHEGVVFQLYLIQYIFFINMFTYKNLTIYSKKKLYTEYSYS